MTSQSDRDISYFAKTNFRNRNIRFGIKQADRLSHVYVIGKTGVGKSTLIQTLARQDIQSERGFALIDPHGDLAEGLMASLSPSQSRRVIYLNAADPGQPYGYNPLRRVRDDKIPLAVSGLMETLKKLWPDAWGVRMEHVLCDELFRILLLVHISLLRAKPGCSTATERLNASKLLDQSWT
jgi:Cdc6-like AAA superfamily ATPase